MNTRHRAFTIIELLALTGVGTVAACVVAVCQPEATTRAVARQLKDQSQLRGIHQGMVVFAQDNQDWFPLPSRVDPDYRTVTRDSDKELGPLVDSTRNIFSIPIYQGYIPLEAYVSPAESNPQIKIYTNYQFDEPEAADGDPWMAYWDPAFRATPEDAPVGAHQRAGDPGGFSYAHAVPLGGRRGIWRTTADSRAAILANRGPSYRFDGDAVDGVWRLVDDARADNESFDSPMGGRSNTLLIHGNRDAWSGNVVLNDNTCLFVDGPAPAQLLFTFDSVAVGENGQTDSIERTDNLFVREDDHRRTPQDGYLDNLQTFGGDGEPIRNNYLRSYAGGPGTMTAGGTPTARTFTIDVFLD